MGRMLMSRLVTRTMNLMQSSTSTSATSSSTNFGSLHKLPGRAPLGIRAPSHQHFSTCHQSPILRPSGAALRSIVCGAQVPRQAAGFMDSKGGRQPVSWLHRRMFNGAAPSPSTVATFVVPLILAYLARGSFANVWAAYCRVLETHPLPTKMATGAVGTFIGDLLAQYLAYVQTPKASSTTTNAAGVSSSSSSIAQGSSPSQIADAVAASPASGGFVYDIPRATRMILYATFIASPLGHAWFGLLDGKVFPNAPVSPQAIVTKMLCDQLVACPLLTSVFFMVMKAWEGQPEQAWPTVQEKLGPTLKANYILWPAAHLVGFAFVPPSQRILYVNVIAIFWTAYVSTILNNKPSVAEVPVGDAGMAVPIKTKNNIVSANGVNATSRSNNGYSNGVQMAAPIGSHPMAAAVDDAAATVTSLLQPSAVPVGGRALGAVDAGAMLRQRGGPGIRGAESEL